MEHVRLVSNPFADDRLNTLLASHAFLFRELGKLARFSTAFKGALGRELSSATLPEGHRLFKAGAVADQVYFLESGLAMSYTESRGQKIVDAFFGPGELVTAPGSFIGQTASKQSVLLLEKCKVSWLSHASALKLLASYAEARFLLTTVLSRYMDHELAQRLCQKRLPALVRYRHLLKRLPALSDSTTQEDIASYLGITPQSLSRLLRTSRNPRR
jgi:CRP-like cAMP-binding protein